MVKSIATTPVQTTTRTSLTVCMKKTTERRSKLASDEFVEALRTYNARMYEVSEEADAFFAKLKKQIVAVLSAHGYVARNVKVLEKKAVCKLFFSQEFVKRKLAQLSTDTVKRLIARYMLAMTDKLIVTVMHNDKRMHSSDDKERSMFSELLFIEVAPDTRHISLRHTHLDKSIEGKSTQSEIHDFAASFSHFSL